MPTILGERYPPAWEGIPPHMYGEDLEVWERYREQISREAIAVYFDVGLGGQIEVPPGTPPEFARMWLRNTQKRADVVLETMDHWVIIELKAIATSEAVGRILMYRDLWEQDPPDDREVKLRIVTGMIDMDTERLCKVLKIEYVKVET